MICAAVNLPASPRYSTRSGLQDGQQQSMKAYRLAQYDLTRQEIRRIALSFAVGMALLVLCASFVPVGLSAWGVDTQQIASDPAAAALRPIAHLLSTDVVVPSLHRTSPYATYSHIVIVSRTTVRRLASGGSSVWMQMLAMQGAKRLTARNTAQTHPVKQPLNLPLLI